MKSIQKLREQNVEGKKVVVRVDYNVPLSKGVIGDDFRIRASLPTLRYLLDEGARQIVCFSHLGRPGGIVDESLSLKPVQKRLSELLGKRVGFSTDFEDVGDERVVLFENIRFFKGEKENSDELGKKIAGVGDFFVNDAFGVSHRKHASVHATSKYLPGCVGLLVQKELDVFNNVLSNPVHPFVSIIGGSKLKTKIPLLENLLKKTDTVLVGGAMIFTFYKALGFEVGKSLVDKEGLEDALRFEKHDSLILPEDVNVAKSVEAKEYVTKSVEEMNSDDIGLDIGEESVELFKKILGDAKVVVWNGPLGYYENEVFARATNDLMRFLAKSDVKTILGGGDTAAVASNLGLQDSFHHVSTGGGASMTLLKGEELVALEHVKK